MDYFETCYSDCVARMKGKWKNARFFKLYVTLFSSKCHHLPLISRVVFFFFHSLREFFSEFVSVCKHHSYPMLYLCHLTSPLIMRHRLPGLWLFVVIYHQQIKSEWSFFTGCNGMHTRLRNRRPSLNSNYTLFYLVLMA